MIIFFIYSITNTLITVFLLFICQLSEQETWQTAWGKRQFNHAPNPMNVLFYMLHYRWCLNISTKCNCNLNVTWNWHWFEEKNLFKDFLLDFNYSYKNVQTHYLFFIFFILWNEQFYKHLQIKLHLQWN